MIQEKINQDELPPIESNFLAANSAADAAFLFAG